MTSAEILRAARDLTATKRQLIAAIQKYGLSHPGECRAEQWRRRYNTIRGFRQKKQWLDTAFDANPCTCGAKEIMDSIELVEKADGEPTG